jgi:hypothetical protein
MPPVGLSDLANVPNPFNPSTVIRFTVHREGPASLQVFDARGYLVRTLFAGDLPAGPHAFRWDGRDDAGRSQPSGVYVYRLGVAGDIGIRKMMLMK